MSKKVLTFIFKYDTNSKMKIERGDIMRKKIMLFAIVLCVLSFISGVLITKGFAEEPTKTFYNNKVPYDAFFSTHDPNLIKVQVGEKQGVIPVINDAEKDLTQKDTKKGK